MSYTVGARVIIFRFSENISFEAEHPKKGRYTKKTLVEHKFEGPKDSEWREKAPKLPKNGEKIYGKIIFGIFEEKNSLQISCGIFQWVYGKSKK